MPKTILRFDGKRIAGAESTRSKVFAAFDWKEMLFSGPGQAIEAKAKCGSRQLRAFPESDWPALKRVLGHYSDVQSERSEDTVTWGAFAGAESKPWLCELLREAFDHNDLPTDWSFKFWNRFKHPHTGDVASGPEADLVISTPGWLYVVEAKWCQDIDGCQGTDKQTTQLEMRAIQAASRGIDNDRRGVLVIVPEPTRYDPIRKTGSVFRRYFELENGNYVPTPAARELGAVCITWGHIAEMMDKHGDHSRAEYLRWRIGRLPVVSNPLRATR